MAYYFQSILLLIASVLVYPSVSQVPAEENITQTLQNGVVNLALKLTKLIQQKNTKNENVLISPFNIHTALGLVHLGSDGTTRDEVSDVMGIPKNIEVSQLHQAIKTSLTSLQESREVRTIQDGNPVIGKVTNIKVANGIFVQHGTALKESYKADLSSYYNSEISDVDFVSKAAEATNIVNQYIANKTENQIPQLYPEPLSTDTRIILTSALYFSSVWDVKFDKKLTQVETFHAESGDVNVNMMHKNMDMAYANFPDLGAEACNMWFGDNVISMFVVMPNGSQTLNNFITRLTSNDINDVIKKTNKNYILDLKLPKTNFKWSKGLKQELIELGAKSMFTHQANLGNMIVENKLSVSEVDHATKIKIDEDGTEASAVTAVKVGLRSASRSVKQVFHVNRPFLVIIYHHEIKSILFLGSVHNPNES